MDMQTLELRSIKNTIARDVSKERAEYPTLRDKIRAEKSQREERRKAFARLYELADEQGRSDAEAVRPEPMIVKDMQTGHVFAPVMEGVCGFAWVTVRPGTSSFARWAKDQKGWSKGYPDGMQLWVHGYGQSYERKMAYAQGFASILREAGIKASPGGRLD